jgi:formylglycine-generating enzyme required for sulfatase activity
MRGTHLSLDISVSDAAGQRNYGPGELPIAVGVPDNTGVRLQADPPGRPVAFVGFSAGRFFLQPAADRQAATLNNGPFTESIWLDGTQSLIARGCVVTFSIVAEHLSISVEPDSVDRTTVPPVVVAVPDPSIEAPVEQTISAAAYQSGADTSTKSGRRFPVVAAVLWTALAILASSAWFMFTARSVEVIISPVPETYSVGGALVFRFGPRYLMRPGSYQVTASLTGYEPLNAVVEVSQERAQSLQLTMERLGDKLFVDTPGVPDAEVRIDGEIIGTTPVADHRIRPGRHRVIVAADRYVPDSSDLDIEGGGNEVRFDIDLIPDWAVVTLGSQPAGASLFVDGNMVAQTPAQFDLRSGNHKLELRLPGYKTWRQQLVAEANKPVTLDEVTLRPSDGTLRVGSSPSGATVLVNGDFRGQTPMTIELDPGRSFKVQVSQAGYKTDERSIRLKSGETRSTNIELEVINGIIEMRVEPEGTILVVDGLERGVPPSRLELIAIPHRLEFRKEGYVSQIMTVSPTAGIPQKIRVRLLTEEEAAIAAIPPRITTSQGAELVLVRAGKFTMGTARGAAGRRANEGAREVQLTKPYYIGVKEVTNKEFTEFKRSHKSGTAIGYGLNSDDYPVVRVSWQDAAAYCNWLSQKQSLPPAYRTEEARLVSIWPPTQGYRLPTEAEWVWAMRYSGRPGKPSRYSWGDTMPPPAGAENVADQSARAGLREVLKSYNDDYPITAPVGTFSPSPLGIYDSGGNAAEWMADLYRAYTGLEEGVDIDPIGAEDGRYYVIRGPSWSHSSITELRLAYRDSGDELRPDVGFRIARSVN